VCDLKTLCVCVRVCLFFEYHNSKLFCNKPLRDFPAAAGAVATATRSAKDVTDNIFCKCRNYSTRRNFCRHTTPPAAIVAEMPQHTNKANTWTESR
jgi:hypothetical protein